MKERLQALRDAKLTLGMVLLILVALASVAFAMAAVSWVRAERQRDALESQIAAGEDVLATGQEVRDELDRLPGDVAVAQDQLASGEAAFPTELDANDVLENVLGLAEEAGTSVLTLQLQTSAQTSVQTSADEAAQAGDAVAQDASLNVALQVEGTYARLIELLRLLEERAGATVVASYAIQGGDDGLTMKLELRTFARQDEPVTSEAEPEASP